MASEAQTFIALEESLTARLLDGWSKKAASIAKKIHAAFAIDDTKAVHDLIASIDLVHLYDDNKSYVEFIGLSAYFFGVGRHGDAKKSKAMKVSAKPKIIESACKQVRAMLAKSEHDLRIAIDIMVDAEYQRLKDEGNAPVRKAEALRDFVSFLTVGVEEGGSAAAQLVSGLHTSRLAQYGYCVEATLVGVKRYQINEMLDSRTCPVCRVMNGKTFDVAPTYEKLSYALSLDDPNDLKQVLPWPSQSKDNVEALSKMTAQELSDRGWATPPFHPGCRGYLDYTEQQQVIMDTAFPMVELIGMLPTPKELIKAGIVPEALVAVRPPLLAAETASYSVDVETGLVVELRRNMETGVVVTTYLDPTTFEEVVPKK